jgi:hypothetical protein
LGQAEHSPDQKNQAQEEKKTAREGDWREVEAGGKRIFPKPLTLQVIGSRWWAGVDSLREQKKTKARKMLVSVTTYPASRVTG